MKRVILILLVLGLLPFVACGNSEPHPNNHQDPDMGDTGIDEGDDSLDGGPDADMPNPNNQNPDPYKVVTVEADSDALVQVIEGTTQFVTFPNAAGKISVWEAATAERETLDTTAPGPGLIWTNPETGDYVIGVSSGDRVLLNAWEPEAAEFASFAGPLTKLWPPAYGSQIGYASRPDGSLAMIDFAQRTALVLDATFGDGEVVDIEPMTGRALYRRGENPDELLLFDPALKTKTPAPPGDFAVFLGDGAHIYVSNDALGSRIYDPSTDVLKTVAPQATTNIEVHRRFVAIKFPDRNDVLYDLQEERSVLVGTNISVPPNPWSPENRYFVLTGRGPTVIDTMTGLGQVVVGTGVVEQVEFSDDNTRMSLIYSGFRPRLVVFDLVDQKTLYTDEVVRITDENEATPDEVTPLSMDASGRWVAYFDTKVDGVGVSVYDSVDDTLWAITEEAPLTTCGLAMAADGSALMLPSLGAAGETIVATWTPGAEQVQALATNVVMLNDCVAPAATPNLETIFTVETDQDAQRLVLRTGGAQKVIASGFTLTSLRVDDALQTFDMTYNTVTGSRETAAIVRYTVSDDELKTIDTQALRSARSRVRNDQGLAYRFIPEGCAESCLIGIRAFQYGDDAPYTLTDIGGEVRALVGPHVVFQGGRIGAGDEIISELKLGRRIGR